MFCILLYYVIFSIFFNFLINFSLVFLMNKQYIFIFVILIIFICVNIREKETFTNKYNIILINHNNYQIFIVKNTSNTNKKIYKIYKN